MPTLGKRLKELRQSIDKTQVELAKILGVSQSTYALYETDSRQPDYEKINFLADYFKVSTDYLLGRTAEKKELSLHDALESNPFIEFIAARLSKMADAGEKAFGTQDPFVSELRKFNSMSKEERESLLSGRYSKVIEENGKFTLVSNKITPDMETKILNEIKNLPEDVQQAIITNLNIKK